MTSETHKSEPAKAYLNQLEKTLDEYLVKKAPALPKNAKEILVNFAPWLVVLGIIISVPAIISGLGLSAMLASTPYAAAYVGAALGPTYYISIIILAISLVLEIIALPGLFSRKKSGWNLVFYATLVSAVSSLISMNIIGLIIGTLISLYLLFQIKEYYK